MRKPLCISLTLLALLLLATGCQSGKSARKPQRFRTEQYSFTDLSARSDYIERRKAELTDKGVSPQEAGERASREWFSRAPVATEVPTQYELKRREAEADIRSYLDQRSETSGR